MSIYRYEEAFGAADKTTAAMRSAREKWRALYFSDTSTEGSDPCQRIGYTIVSKVVNAMFGEYRAEGKDPAVAAILGALGEKKKQALQLLLSEGECYIKPYPVEGGFAFTVVPRSNILLFGRDTEGRPNDIGTVEKTTFGKFYYTLLERRTVDEAGFLTVKNALYRSQNRENLGTQVPLSTHPGYREMAERYRFTEPLGLGLVGLKTPILNCVDGSEDGVAIFAPAVGLIQNINKNESQLCGEFDRGESRVIASADLLRDGLLQDTLFVGLDDDPEQVGITVFSPQLREESYINRKQEYLRNVESIIGLRRGMLSNADESDRTATEITSSAGDFNLVVISYQEIWERAVRECIDLCKTLGKLYGHIKISDPAFSIDWGNSVLYDEDKTWEFYQEMVNSGMLAPEVALGWRFNLPAETAEEKALIRERYMPKAKTTIEH